MYLFMKESRAVIGGVRLREEPLTIWTRYIRNGYRKLRNMVDLQR